MLDSKTQKIMLEAVRQHQAEQFQAAERLYREVLDASPGFPEATHNLGVLAMQSGQGLTVALPLFRAAWEANPAHQQHWLSYLKALTQAGDSATAETVYSDGRKRGLEGPAPGGAAPAGARQGSPAKPAGKNKAQLQAAYNAVVASLERNDLDAARQGAMALYKQSPDSSLALKAVGLALNAEGKKDAACNALQQSLNADTTDIELAVTLGSLYHETARYQEAEKTLAQALQQAPTHEGAASALAEAQLKQYKPADAEATCRQALAQQGDRPALLHTLAQALQAQARDEEAIDAYSKALQLQPDHAAAYRALGSMLLEMNREEQLLPLCRSMLAAQPDNPGVQKDLADLLLRSGDVAGAASAYEAALALKPDDLTLRSSALFCRNFLSEQSGNTLKETARQFGETASAGLTAYQAWRCDNQPERLRVGLVSGDLYSHPVGYFLESVLANTDSTRIEWFVYATTAAADDLTQRLQQHVAQWQVVAGLDAGECARRIHEDGPHILIDLAGHTAHSMLSAFCYRPAPVQVSWLGYFATTGVQQIDYFIADPVSVPSSAESDFVETIWHLPDTRLCFTAPGEAPEVNELPALQSGNVTFGCFQQMAKITDNMLALWATLLQRAPEAKLLLQNASMDNAQARDEFTARARASGVPVERLIMRGATSRQDYLARHHQVDILLDTHPFSGATTTSEALWMGVPTVTLAGEQLVARQGASIMAAAGLPDWVAHTPDDYVSLALEQSADLQRLAAVRARLRHQVSQSPLYDAPRFAQNLAEALWGMWESKNKD